MSLKHRLMPWFAGALTSRELRDLQRGVVETRRRLLGRPRDATFYFRVDDPYSWLMAQVLPDLAQALGLRITPRTMLYVDEELYPAIDLLHTLAGEDARRLAALHGLAFPEKPARPDPDLTLTASRILMRHEQSGTFFELAHQLSHAVWHNDRRTVEEQLRRYDATASDKAVLALQARRDRFIREGHYLTGNLHYGGEWYWSMERLDHLVQRLDPSGKTRAALPDYGKAKTATLWGKPRPGEKRELELFFSFRSPYSYLALERARALTEHYRLTLRVRPVLPMVMRGLSVPSAKKFYILHDAAREARLHNVPFGRVCDPVGAGVERCMALWPFAEKESRLNAYLRAAARMIWSEGANVASDADLERVCDAAGLDWNRARRWLDDDGWRARAEQNRADMLASGSWGVPTFRLDGHTVWGQDRFGILEKIILSGEQP